MMVASMRTFPMLLLLACAFTAHAGTMLEMQASGVDVRLRGISAVDVNTAWASGQKGTVLRTVDGGEQWQAVQVQRLLARLA